MSLNILLVGGSQKLFYIHLDFCCDTSSCFKAAFQSRIPTVREAVRGVSNLSPSTTASVRRNQNKPERMPGDGEMSMESYGP